MTFSRPTLAALEYPSYLALLAAEARTDLGAGPLLARMPTADRDELERRRAAYDETRRLAVEAALVPSLDEAFAPLLRRLDGEEESLDGLQILALARLLTAAGEARRRVLVADPPCAELARRLEGSSDPAPLLAEVARVLDRKGRVRDDASPRLGELSRQVRTSRDRLYARLEQVRSANVEAFSEETVPLRGGRLLLLLSAGARGKVPGLVHGRSASGRSFYFEPLDAVEDNNTLATAVEELEAERQRLLRELLAAFAAAAPLVRELADFIGEIDALEAAGRFAQATGGRLPEIAPARRLRLVAACHPLIDPRLAGRRERVLGASGHAREVIPLDLELEPTRRVLVVTGPNAGGKTVALKTVGLAALATQAGLPFPCAAGSELPVFAQIVATVGDEQDLLAERSTFSGRLERLVEAWRGAGPESLAWLDALGSGSDPEEGAALAIALVERLLAGGGLALVTTHLSPVALAALESEGAASAAMEFKPLSGRPTFRLRPGAPGASEAIALARRLGLPAEWIARAEQLVGPGHRQLHRVLAELEAMRVEHARAAQEAEAQAAEAAATAARLERERAALEAERRVAAQKMRGELQSFRERVTRELATEAERLRRDFAAGKRRGLESAAAERLFSEAPEFASGDDADNGVPLVVGGTVRHRRLGWSGRLERLEGERAEVLVGGKRVRCAAGDLAGTTAAPAVATPRAARSGGDEPPAAGELMLLGRTVEEALEAVDDYLDRALRSALREARLVHGHGTGRLRDAIRQHLRHHPAVASFRSGEPKEGGNGATVVALRD